MVEHLHLGMNANVGDFWQIQSQLFLVKEQRNYIVILISSLDYCQ